MSDLDQRQRKEFLELSKTYVSNDDSEKHPEWFNLAIQLHKFDKKRFAWEKCRDQFIPLLDHPHPMVRAYAAKNIGRFYWYNSLKSRTKQGALSLIEMLMLVSEKEIAHSAVAGPFINGYDDDTFYGLGSLLEVKELGKFDVREWILDILEKSTPNEPYVPNAQ